MIADIIIVVSLTRASRLGVSYSREYCVYLSRVLFWNGACASIRVFVKLCIKNYQLIIFCILYSMGLVIVLTPLFPAKEIQTFDMDMTKIIGIYGCFIYGCL